MSNDNNSQLAWLKIGIQTLDQIGWRALKINDLCQQLKVTKGSFYHWFQSKRDYEMQVLGYWKQRFTQGFIDQAESGHSSREKLSLLGQQIIQGALDGNRLEFEINAWAQQDDEVKAFVTSVYEQRYAYLVRLLKDIYPDPQAVQKHSLTLYSLVIGIDLFYRRLSRAELELIFEDYLVPVKKN
ncbi:TetR/AcrR family transcriptional regulator [Marinicella meishanensis]|uniref:TetR/AcrR family transcriptional regulator n=1 Tax=Marinicella meishanensis TaxID=2873263 RepID=UPI001CBA7B87|nr:TetR/AcrR family transcriptional regulator [Marinicella sp. NBU2979]